MFVMLLKQAGISFIEDIINYEWGDRAFRIKDPIGNYFIFIQSGRLPIYIKCYKGIIYLVLIF